MLGLLTLKFYLLTLFLGLLPYRSIADFDTFTGRSKLGECV